MPSFQVGDVVKYEWDVAPCTSREHRVAIICIVTRPSTPWDGDVRVLTVATDGMLESDRPDLHLGHKYEIDWRQLTRYGE